MSVTTLVAVGDDVEITGDRLRAIRSTASRRRSSPPPSLLAGEGAVDFGSVRSLLNHTSGVRDYGALPEYHAAVRARPGAAWDDDEFLARAHAAGPVRAGNGLGVLEHRLPALAQASRRARRARAVPSTARSGGTTVAEELDDLVVAVPAPSALLLEGVEDVRGVYDPRWVGHRTLVARAGDLLPFWHDLPAGMLDLRSVVPIGFDAPGFVRPSYGLGVMVDPEHPLGALVGHGGGGPGYATAAFALPQTGAVAIVLAADESYPAQERAVELLAAAVRRRR